MQRMTGYEKEVGARTAQSQRREGESKQRDAVGFSLSLMRARNKLIAKFPRRKRESPPLMDKIPSMYVPSFLRLALCFHLSWWNYFNLDLHYIAPLNRSCFLSASSEDDNSPNEANVETFLFKLDIQPFFTTSLKPLQL